MSRTVKRPRRYIASQWMAMLRPFVRYSSSRDAYVLRGIGRQFGPVLREDRRSGRREGAERRRTSVA